MFNSKPPINFPKKKVYKDFGNLLRDIATEHAAAKEGIIVLFNEEGGINVLPVCTSAQCAMTAAILLREAASE